MAARFPTLDAMRLSNPARVAQLYHVCTTWLNDHDLTGYGEQATKMASSFSYDLLPACTCMKSHYMLHELPNTGAIGTYMYIC